MARDARICGTPLSVCKVAGASFSVSVTGVVCVAFCRFLASLSLVLELEPRAPMVTALLGFV